MSEIDINKLRELHAATTQGEWAHSGGDYVWASPDKNNCDAIADTSLDFSDSENRANAAFIAAAHNIWPALLDELERLRDANKMLIGALKVASAECDQLREELKGKI